MEKYKIAENGLNGGIQKKYKFENGYGASVVKSIYSYGGSEGLWEIAVLKYDGENSRLCYDTDITDNVIGHLTDDEVAEILNKIKKLPEITE